MTDTKQEIETHPVQMPRLGPYDARCPKLVTMAAYEVYCDIHRPQEAMVRGGCRGGFGIEEIVAYLYARSFPKSEWRIRVDEAFSGMKLTR